MERFLIICLSAGSGIFPFVCHLEDSSKIAHRVKTIIETCFKDDGPVYAEVYRFVHDDILNYHHSFSYDDATLRTCRPFKISAEILKDFVGINSFSFFSL